MMQTHLMRLMPQMGMKVVIPAFAGMTSGFSLNYVISSGKAKAMRRQAPAASYAPLAGLPTGGGAQSA